MSGYMIDAGDETTEALFLAYKEAQNGLRQRVAGLYDAAAGTLRQYAALEDRMGGDLAALAEYHAAKAATLGGDEAGLVEAIVALLERIVAMQAQTPGLFPGVPTGE